MTQQHVMVDLETLGNGNEAVLLSLGAVKFTADEIVDKFHVAIDPASCQRYGLKIDAETVMWWLNPERAQARDALFDNEMVDIASALDGFSTWFGTESLPLWGNGATFDNIILRSAYKALGMTYPARFWDDQCYRTMKYRAKEIELIRVGVHHDALDDAESQARHLQEIARHLGITL